MAIECGDYAMFWTYTPCNIIRFALRPQELPRLIAPARVSLAYYVIASLLRLYPYVTHWPTNPTQPRTPTAKIPHITLRLGGEPTR